MRIGLTGLTVERETNEFEGSVTFDGAPAFRLSGPLDIGALTAAALPGQSYEDFLENQHRFAEASREQRAIDVPGHGAYPANNPNYLGHDLALSALRGSGALVDWRQPVQNVDPKSHGMYLVVADAWAKSETLIAFEVANTQEAAYLTKGISSYNAGALGAYGAERYAVRDVLSGPLTKVVGEHGYVISRDSYPQWAHEAVATGYEREANQRAHALASHTLRNGFASALG